MRCGRAVLQVFAVFVFFATAKFYDCIAFLSRQGLDCFLLFVVRMYEVHHNLVSYGVGCFMREFQIKTSLVSLSFRVASAPTH